MIIGLSGAIGTGKSWTMQKQALYYAEMKRKQLVFNYPVNIKAIYAYAALPKELDSPFFRFLIECGKVIDAYKFLLGLSTRNRSLKFKPRLPWVKYLCENGGISQIPSPKKLEALLIPESVVCLDEAGVFLNSREFMHTSKRLLADLCQSRKDGVDLIWASQFDEQVDKQVRLLTQFWIHCDSVSIYDKRLRRPKLVWKRIYWFRAYDYNHWSADVAARTSHFRTRFAYSMQYEGGPLSFSDRLIFQTFDSFSRLDDLKGGASISTLQRCVLPSDYFFRFAYQVPLQEFSSEVTHQVTHKESFPEVTHQVTHKSVVPGKTQLIREALALARANRVSAPYLKSMSESDIVSYIVSLKASSKK